MEDEILDNLWVERKELLKAEEYQGDDDLQCTCGIEGVACAVHPEKEKKIEEELED